MKKIIAVLLSILTVLSFGVVAFAGDTTEEEEEVKYAKGTSINTLYQITTGDDYEALKAEIEMPDGKKYFLKDTTDYSALDYTELEAVTVVAYYATKCPVCGKAVGGTNYKVLMGTLDADNRCPHCVEAINKELKEFQKNYALGNYDTVLGTAENAVKWYDEKAAAETDEKAKTTYEEKSTALSGQIDAYNAAEDETKAKEIISDIKSKTEEYYSRRKTSLTVFTYDTLVDNGDSTGALYFGEEELKVYRFAYVPSTSAHYKQYKLYDFTDAVEPVFGETAKYYGDGEDLPQQYLDIREEYQIKDGESTGKTVYRLYDFETSGTQKIDTDADNFLGKILAAISQLIEKIKVNGIVLAIENFFSETLTKLIGGVNSIAE